MTTVVVTGGGGRLGRSVVTALVDAGYDVVSFDLAAGDRPTVPTVQVDLTDPRAAERAFREVGAQAVVHLAAIAVPFSAPEETILATNAAMAYNVLTAATASGATRVLVASSPTVIGYGAPHGWAPLYLPIDEDYPATPWNAYALSKSVVEATVRMAVARDGDRVRFGVFRPCFVIAPDEWLGAPTQQGHTVAERLDNPGLGAVSLFNYVDARDAAEFVRLWIDRAYSVPNGSVFFVGAADAMAREPLDRLIPRFLLGSDAAAATLTGTAPAFSSAKAERLLGWRGTRSWRTELVSEPQPADAGRAQP